MKKLSGLERSVLALTLLFFLATAGWFILEDRDRTLTRVEVSRPEQIEPAGQAAIDDPAPGILEGELLNINTAPYEELTRLPGIGEVKAKSIVEHRQENGLFSKKEDIIEVFGIGEVTYETIEAYITVE